MRDLLQIKQNFSSSPYLYPSNGQYFYFSVSFSLVLEPERGCIINYNVLINCMCIDYLKIFFFDKIKIYFFLKYKFYYTTELFIKI